MLLLRLCAALAVGVLASRCPCDPGPLESRSLVSGGAAPLAVCMHSSSPAGAAAASRLSALAVGFTVVELSDASRGDQAAECSVLLRLEPSKAPSATTATTPSVCPGKCFPTPELTLPLEWFTGLAASATHTTLAALYQAPSVGGRRDHAVMCSLEMRHLMHLAATAQEPAHYAEQAPAGAGAGAGAGASVSLARLILELSWRRIQECREQKYWKEGHAKRVGEMQAQAQGQGQGQAQGQRQGHGHGHGHGHGAKQWQWAAENLVCLCWARLGWALEGVEGSGVETKVRAEGEGERGH